MQLDQSKWKFGDFLSVTFDARWFFVLSRFLRFFDSGDQTSIVAL